MSMEKFPKIDNKGAPSNELITEFLDRHSAKPEDHSREHERMADEGCPNHE